MGPKIFPLNGTFFRKTEKAEKFFEIFIFSMKKNFFFMMNKNSKKKIKEKIKDKNFIKFLAEEVQKIFR
jgi:hypothetical protein